MSRRMSWNKYFMEITELVASRSTCDRAWVGCVIVNDSNRIVSTGYNGSVSGNPHCDDVGHTMRDGHCIATIHAEMNALLYCAKEGIPVNKCVAYVTHFPCLNCTKSLIQAGIKKIYYKNDYRVDEYAIQLLDTNNILYEKIT
ncbi:deoxycytidylate deaminase [Gudongella sp. DL1XJH-153]|uniref:deoxycytidylate deaminase n=1 Tax=Gudongella sp. DL1XJH-153 TaxID=3409804 RepID=UPI003BB4BCBD